MALNVAKLVEKTSRQLASGQLVGALKTTKLGLQAFPKNPYFHNFLGLIHARQGKHRLAADSFRRTLALASDSIETQDNFIQALVLSDQFSTALAQSEQFLKRATQLETLYYLRAMAHLRRGDPDNALLEINEAIARNPAQPRTLSMKAQALAGLGHFDQAAQIYAQIAPLVPDELYPILEQVNALLRAKSFPAATKILTSALTKDAKNPDLWGQLGIIEMMSGDMAAASTAFFKQLELNPHSGSAFLSLASAVPLSEVAALKTRLEDQLAQKKALDTHNRSLMSFALAKTLEREGDKEAESRALKTANDLQREPRPYEPKSADALFERFTNVQVQPAVQPSPARPLLIIGMPRSGTTLLERVIAAHSDVTALGEFEGGQRVCLRAEHAQGEILNGDALAKLYLGNLPQALLEGAPFSDKLPSNYRILGALTAAFPNARVIHLERDPRDVALSTWRAYFAEAGLNYAFNFKAMAHEFNLYRRYMAHWASTSETPMLRLSYEDLVTDLAASTTKVAAFCGLEWHSDMTRPEDTKSPVLTNSVVQARQSIHRDSIGGAQDYPEIAERFAKHLDPHLWPEI